MTYLVMEIQKWDTGSFQTPVYSYDNINSAEAKFHSILAAAAVSTLPIHSCVLMNESGFTIKSQSYTHVVESESTDTETEE